eukprot:scaffold3999_cov138-Skeletonema_dohrnii-CCMP3373.AAC.31
MEPDVCVRKGIVSSEFIVKKDKSKQRRGSLLYRLLSELYLRSAPQSSKLKSKLKAQSSKLQAPSSRALLLALLARGHHNNGEDYSFMEEGGIMMAEAHEDGEMFVYMGGDQVVPMDVVRVRIAKSIKIIPTRAFQDRRHLIYVEFHDGIEIIEKGAFNRCYSLRGSVKLLGVKVIEYGAFASCFGLIDVEFGVELETIEDDAFSLCYSLRIVTMPSVTVIGSYAFGSCRQLTDLDLPEGLETIKEYAFHNCQDLERIAIPLDCMIGNNIFCNCPKLATVDLVGGIHNTVASLHLENWRNEMKGEINRINQVLRDARAQEKTAVTQQWIRSVIRQFDHYKAEHKAMLKEATTLLELALWKADLNEKEEGLVEREGVRTTRGRRKRARKEICITSGASIVIKNVLPFLELK